MRLSNHERRVFREAGLHHFGTVPGLFGSRLGDRCQGGDTDRAVSTGLRSGPAVRRRMDLLAGLWPALGERKIDIVLDDGAGSSAIVVHARHEGVAI